MSLQPILNAPFVVILHFFTVVPAFFMGAWMLLASVKGSPVHRTVGKIYLLLMAVTAVAACFIRAPANWPHVDVGPSVRLSFIHLFIPLTLFGVYGAIATIRRRDIAGHRHAMVRMYVGALLIAGILSFMPGRIMHAVVFGGASWVEQLPAPPSRVLD